MTRYMSTRGGARKKGFEEVLLSGLAPDGGLYMPEKWPLLTPGTRTRLAGAPYEDIAYAVLRPLTGSLFSSSALRTLITRSLARFEHEAVCPLVQIAPDLFVMELFHGPSFAFKDLAMQLIAPMLDTVLARRKRRALVIVATSGDTGAAALEAFRESRRADVFALYPEGRISPAQRRQMTTQEAPHLHALAIDGTFDDCQHIAKTLLADKELRAKNHATGVNSINWARIAAQIVYYVSAALTLSSCGRKVSFCVPTGNVGNVFAGYAALRMGAPVGKLLVATNANDVLVRALKTGRYAPRRSLATLSPSMDIQVPSNFERLLFDANGRRAAALVRSLDKRAQKGSVRLEKKTRDFITRRFDAGTANDTQTLQAIRDMYENSGYIMDPHTAVAASVLARQKHKEGPWVILGTAHPAKFPDAIQKALGRTPDCPEGLAQIETRRERIHRLPKTPEAVRAFIMEARAG